MRSFRFREQTTRIEKITIEVSWKNEIIRELFLSERRVLFFLKQSPKVALYRTQWFFRIDTRLIEYF